MAGPLGGVHTIDVGDVIAGRLAVLEDERHAPPWSITVDATHAIYEAK